MSHQQPIAIENADSCPSFVLSDMWNLRCLLIRRLSEHTQPQNLEMRSVDWPDRHRQFPFTACTFLLLCRPFLVISDSVLYLIFNILMINERRRSREIASVLNIIRSSTSLWVGVVASGCVNWSPQTVLEDGVEDDGDDEQKDGDVELDGDTDESSAEEERQCGASSLQCPTALERHVVLARWTARTDEDYRHHHRWSNKCYTMIGAKSSLSS